MTKRNKHAAENANSAADETGGGELITTAQADAEQKPNIPTTPAVFVIRENETRDPLRCYLVTTADQQLNPVARVIGAEDESEALASVRVRFDNVHDPLRVFPEPSIPLATALAARDRIRREREKAELRGADLRAGRDEETRNGGAATGPTPDVPPPDESVLSTDGPTDALNSAEGPSAGNEEPSG